MHLDGFDGSVGGFKPQSLQHIRALVCQIVMGFGKCTQLFCIYSCKLHKSQFFPHHAVIVDQESTIDPSVGLNAGATVS